MDSHALAKEIIFLFKSFPHPSVTAVAAVIDKALANEEPAPKKAPKKRTATPVPEVSFSSPEE